MSSINPPEDLHPAPCTPQEALQRLQQGNWRFRAGNLAHQPGTPGWHVAAASQQFPFAAVLGCSDSRLLVETLFDVGRGDLFVCRVAGQVLDDAVTGSLEFAAVLLRVPLILVLGHENCGAVTAACVPLVPGEPALQLLRRIQPAVERARGHPGELLENAVREHVRSVVLELRQDSPLLTALCATGDLMIEGAYYHMDTGEVELLSI